VPPERIRIVPNGVDTQKVSPSVRTAQRDEMRRRLHIQRDETLFLFAAHNPRLKGIRPLLRALAELRRGQPGAVLAVIGKDPPAGIRRTAARLNIEDSIRFAGYVDAPLSYYAAADAFVLPTFYDACSLTVLEACACALPVITSKYNGVSELMTHGREGWIIDNPRDFRELAQAMAHCADAAHSGSMSAAARELALRNTMEQNVTAIERVYLECLAHRRREIGKS
jgi:UDP-glucose:(heptosyl)LPS alpha-1,3-glucosyltransferase